MQLIELDDFFNWEVGANFEKGMVRFCLKMDTAKNLYQSLEHSNKKNCKDIQKIKDLLYVFTEDVHCC